MEPENKKTKDICSILHMLQRLGQMTTIDESLIEEGFILKSSIYEDDECIVSMLILSPGAKIKEHEHLADTEVYYLVRTGEIRKCEIGESHSLENPDKEDWMPVISIKHPK
jgi:quercetin dioxygenase-like cupin family protein